MGILRDRPLESHPTFPETGLMADRMCDTEDSLSCYHLAECSNGRERDYGNKLLPSTAGTSLTAPPSQVPWHKGKRQPNNNKDDDSPGMEVLVRVN